MQLVRNEILRKVRGGDTEMKVKKLEVYDWPGTLNGEDRVEKWRLMRRQRRDEPNKQRTEDIIYNSWKAKRTHGEGDSRMLSTKGGEGK